jgi:hypothetical protein
VRRGDREWRPTSIASGASATARAITSASRLVFEFGDQMKQIATQLATIAAGEPCDARSIEGLGDGIRGRNRL